MSALFDWHHSPAVVVREIPAIAVYGCTDGDIVIRQQDSDEFTPPDPAISFPKDRAGPVVMAVLRLVQIDEAKRIALSVLKEIENFKLEGRSTLPLRTCTTGDLFEDRPSK